MSWLLVAIFSRLMSGSVAVVDKLLLKKSYPNPWGYSFWVGILGLAALVIIPFGFEPLGWPIVALALLTGMVFVAAVFLNVFALYYGQASVAAILIGATLPVFTLFFGISIIHLTLMHYQTVGFLLLLGGSFLLFLAEDAPVRFKVFLLAIASAALYGLSDALTKLVFYNANFITGFSLIKVGGALGALSFLLLPRARKHILPKKISGVRLATDFRNKWAFLTNRVVAGIGSITIYYAISLGNPALVDSTMSLQYVFIFLGGILLLKERFRGKVLIMKLSALGLAVLGIIWLGGGAYLEKTAPNPNRQIEWGVTFSEKFSKQMGLDWKQNYDAVLNDLGARHLRLVAYWDDIEAKEGTYNFADLDYQMREAEKDHADVILAVGERVPRWPECHLPSWTNSAPAADKDRALLEYMRIVITRYENSPALKYWQIENEPFLNFGECPPVDPGFLDQEINLAHALDPAHKVLTTDGGEFGDWYRAASRGDAFGTTMYRRVHTRYFGYIQYPLPPEYFRIKEALVQKLTGDYEKPYIVIELGTEPWLEHQLYETSTSSQLAVFDLPFFKDTISYAKSAGFDSYYLWGTEWWYWMKTKQGHPEFWDYAKTIFANQPQL